MILFALGPDAFWARSWDAAAHFSRTPKRNEADQHRSEGQIGPKRDEPRRSIGALWRTGLQIGSGKQLQTSAPSAKNLLPKSDQAS